MKKTFLIIAFSVIVCSCGPVAEEVTQIQARVAVPTVSIEPGEHSLDLGGPLLINGTISWRDGTLYIPRISTSRTLMPLLVWLHHGGGRASDFQYMFSLAEELGIVILTIDARHNTWDGIDSPFGPDVMFINTALRHTFERIAIDPLKIGLGGISDGASYALALGRTNGDFFTHLIAFAPGYLNPPAPPTGNPRIFVAHGIRDNVYNVLNSRRFIVPGLKKAGYDVTYHEFDGPHWAPIPVARQALMWLAQ